MKIRYMILAGILLLLAGCGSKEADQCYQEGIAALEAKDYDEAMSCFELLIANGDRLAEAYRGCGIAWMEQGAYPEAIAAFSRSLNNLDGKHPEFADDVRFYLAKMRLATGEYDKAIEVYSSILAEDAQHEQALFLRGRVYLQQKDLQNAEKDFDLLLKGCRDYNWYINIYQVYVEFGVEAEGDKYLQRALDLEPKTGEDYFHRGRIYESQKLYDEAKEMLMTSMEKEYGDALLLLGRIYLKLDDSASARSMYEDYLEQSEKKAQAYNGLAQCDIYDGNYDGALTYIAQGLAEAEAEDLQGLLYNEIVAYEYKKEFETAKQKMAAYLEKYPNDAEALRENEFLSTR